MTVAQLLLFVPLFLQKRPLSSSGQARYDGIISGSTVNPYLLPVSPMAYPIWDPESLGLGLPDLGATFGVAWDIRTTC